MLYGRAAELAAITRLLSAARQGRSGVLVLSGEAGIGKTTLLDHARSIAADARVLTVRGSEPEQQLAFAGLAQAVHPFADWLDRLPDRQARALRGAVALGPAEPGDRFAVYAATLGLLAALADDAPVLLAVDDAQWLDPPSADALAFVGRRLLAEGLAMLIATREPAGRFAGEFSTHLLGGLDDAAAAELVAARTGVRPDPAVLTRLIAATGGNPMALTETAEQLSPAQLEHRQPIPVPTPARVTAQAMFAARVAALGDAARLALLLLATSTDSRLAPVLDAAAILSLSAADFAEVEAAGLARLDQADFTLAHPLVRTAAVAAGLPAQRRAAHRALAAVQTEPHDAEAQAWHLAEATLGTDERVAAALEALATAARDRSGHAAAVAAFERAAALSADDADRARRLHAAAVAAQLAGQPTRARELLVAADALAEDIRLRADIAAARGRVELSSGHPALAYRVVHRAAEAVRGVAPDRAAQLLADAAVAALLAGDAAAAIEAATAAEHLDPCPAPALVLVTRLVRGLTLLHLGQLPDGAPLLVESAALVEATGLAGVGVEYVVLAGLGMVWTGAHARARAMLAPVVAELRSAGALGMLPFALYVSAYAEARSGRMGVARSMAAEAVELARLTGEELWCYLALSALAYVEAISGDVDACRAHAAEASALMRADINYPRDASEALGLLELGLGRYGEAVAHFRAGARQSGAAMGDEPGPEHFDLLEAEIRSGAATGPATLALLDVVTAGDQLPLYAAVGWRLRGLLAGQPALGECFSRALERHAQVDCPFETARTLLSFGERLRRQGERVKAREQLHAALAIFDRLHARTWAERARREISATGEPARAAPRPSALEQLTPQEFQVAMAVSAGATNREVGAALFLSPKTVEFHLSNVYRKLNIRNRAQLAHRFAALAGMSDTP
jgi:DNA-binding CsgD family transcriptional regulator